MRSNLLQATGTDGLVTGVAAVVHPRLDVNSLLTDVAPDQALELVKMPTPKQMRRILLSTNLLRSHKRLMRPIIMFPLLLLK